MCETVTSQLRVFSSYPGTQYILPVDDLEKERLSRQHYMLKQAFCNRLIFPSEASSTLKPGDEILDSATGTGIWLQDFAINADTRISLHGIDINSTNFPPPSSLAPNIQLRIASILSLPSDWTSKFSFVHQRLVFTPSVPKAETPQALSEIYRVLKPGGWVQLLELGDWTAGPLTEKHKSLVLKFTASRGIDFLCCKSLFGLLSQAGFEEVTMVTASTPNGKWAGELGERSRDNLIGAFRAMKNPILNGGGFGVVSCEEEFDKLLDGVENEWNETPGAEVNWGVIYGKKPASN